MKTDLNWKLEKKSELLSKEEVLSHVERLISDVEIAVFLFSKSLCNRPRNYSLQLTGILH